MSGNGINRFTKLLSEHHFCVAGLLCIVVWILTGGSAALLNKAGITNTALMTVHFVIMGAVIFCLLYLVFSKRITDTLACMTLALGGFFARAWYCIFALTTEEYQHDVGAFDYNLANASHDNYILYLLYNKHLPDFDFRGTGQFYHPPLHHFISAVAIKINSVIFPSREGDYGFLMCISLFYSLIVLILIYRILKMFGFTGKSLVIPFAVACFYPYLIISSGQINNDPLASMLFIAAFYNALVWYRERSFKRMIFTALCIGFAMMSKLSAGFVAFPVGFIFLAALIGARGKDKKMWQQFASF